MGIPLRKLWKNRTKQRGPWKVVHRDLFTNAEKMGIDPAHLKIAYPGWERGGQIAHNYAKPINADLENGAVFNSQGIVCVSDTDVIDTNLQLVDLGRGDGDVGTVGSFFFGYQRLSTPSLFYWMALDTGANYALIKDSTNFYFRVEATSVHIDNTMRDIILDYKPHFFGCSYLFGAPVNFVLDSLSSQSINLSKSTSGDKNATVLFGGRSDNTDRYCGGTQRNILASNEYWSQDTLLALADNPEYLWQPVPQKTIFLPLDAGGGTTVTATTGAVVITGINASVSAGTATTITATTGSVSIAGINADISAGKTISVTTGAVVIQGVNASVSAGATITATTGAISINGINATVTNDGSIIVTTGAVIIQGITASISAGRTITAATGAAVVQGINVTVENIQTITTTTGSMSITGVNVDITSSVVIDVITGAVIILGFDASIESGPTAVTPPERIYNIPKTNRVNTIKATRRVYTIT